MKPLFSKSEKEVYQPGDPRRKAFEDKLRSMGRNLEELEGKTIEVDNGGGVKVSLFASHVVIFDEKYLLPSLEIICQQFSTPTTSSISPPSTTSPSPTLTT